MSKPFAIVTGPSSGIGLELAAIYAQEGFDLLVAPEKADPGDVVSGGKIKRQSAIADVTPAGVLAEQHRRMAEPGYAKKGDT